MSSSSSKEKIANGWEALERESEKLASKTCGVSGSSSLWEFTSGYGRRAGGRAPPILKSLAEIHELATRAVVGYTSHDDAITQKFFSDHGIDIEKHIRDIKKIEVPAQLKHTEQKPIDLDIDKLISDHTDKIINDIVLESQELTRREFDDIELADAARDADEFGEMFRRKEDDNRLLAGSRMFRAAKNLLDTSITGNSISLHLFSGSNAEQFLMYCGAIREANVKRKKDEHFGLIGAMRQCCQPSGNSKNNCEDHEVFWKLLGAIVKEDETLLAGRPMWEHSLREIYAEDNRELRNKFLRATKRFLEDQFFETVCRQTKSTPAEHVLNITDAYIQIKDQAMRYRTRVDTHVWHRLYVMLRCRKTIEMIEYLDERCKRRPETAESVKHFRRCFTHYTTSRAPLPENLHQMLLQEYGQYVVNSGNVYQITLYNILGRFDAGQTTISREHEQLIQPCFEDYLWLKISLLWTYEDEMPSYIKSAHQVYDPSRKDGGSGIFDKAPDEEKVQKKWLKPGVLRSMTLEEWQLSVLEEAKGLPKMMRFQALLCSLQFEEAIKFLLSVPEENVLAVHFAIVLDYYGLLKRSKGDQNTISSSSKGLVKSSSEGVNFAGIINWTIYDMGLGKYPEIAFHYLLRLYDPYAKEDKNNQAFIYMLKDLIVKTRDFELLLGRPPHGGGIVGRFLNPDHFDAVITLSAKSCFANDKQRDGIDILYRQKRVNEVLPYICELFASVVAKPHKDNYRQDTIDFCVDKMKNLSRLDLKTGAQELKWNRCGQTFEALQILADFHTTHQKGQPAKALQKFESLAIFPTGRVDRHDFIRASSQINDLGKCVLPPLIFTAHCALEDYFTALTKVHTTITALKKKFVHIRELKRDEDNLIQKHETLCAFLLHFQDRDVGPVRLQQEKMQHFKQNRFC